jgi:septal ring factor EnvC (AmiA/AmiB activator)
MSRRAVVEELQEQIASLVCERQDLRAFEASRASLEQNRLQLVRSQWDLSQALIERHAGQPAWRRF